MNYYDILFARKMAGGQGEITTEGLSVTENGTYTAPESKAYTPVVVNVPTPENAYLLKDIQNVPSDIVTFSDGANLPMPSLKVGIEPQQEGSGDPSPTNVRPISGHTEANIVVSPTTDAEDGTTYNIQFKDGDNPLTVYGGTLDVVSGVLTVDRVMYVADGSESVQSVRYHSSGLYFTVVKGNLGAKTTNPWLISSRFKPQSNVDVAVGNCYITSSGQLLVAVLPEQTATTKEAATQWFADNPTQFVYELATPQTYQLNPTLVKSLLNTNNIWANTGDVLEGSYFKEL